MVKKVEESFVCSSCGNEYGKWQGRCDGCGEWNSLKQFKVSRSTSKSSKIKFRGNIKATNLAKIGSLINSQSVYSSQISELDRVLGKGIVRGSVILFAGEPGIGKSTLLTQCVGKIGGLYVAGEESTEQVFLRVKRLRVDPAKVDVLEVNDVDRVVDFLEKEKEKYKIVVIDSIQMMVSGQIEGSAGSVSQIRECSFRLIEVAKRLKIAIVIIGHVTKTGDIAGPKLLEHMVDVVLSFEGERNSEVRLVRAKKNRFGGIDEIGLFRMSQKGLEEIDGQIGLMDGDVAKIGSVLSVAIEGNRPIILEMQALVTESFGVSPKRVFRGVEFNRGQLLVAVLQKSMNVPLYKYDVFVTISGGINVRDPSLDLAVVASMYSSYKNSAFVNSKSETINPKYPRKRISKQSTKKLVFVGEVSLLGGVRKASMFEKRQKETERMGMEIVKIGDIRELKKILNSNIKNN